MALKQLNHIQQKLKAPKNQYNKFGGYKYRSCEDILEAVKPLLGDCVLLITDEVVLIGDRFYIKATATLKCKEGEISNTAYAREPLSKKGMDEAQITGATSSYARKYALNGLFCIDDTKDADYTNGKNASNTNGKDTSKSKADKVKLLNKQLKEFKEKLGIDKFIECLKTAGIEELKKATIEQVEVALEVMRNVKI